MNHDLIDARALGANTDQYTIGEPDGTLSRDKLRAFLIDHRKHFRFVFCYGGTTKRSAAKAGAIEWIAEHGGAVFDNRGAKIADEGPIRWAEVSLKKT